MKEKGDKRLKDYFLVPPMFCQNKKNMVLRRFN
jgi:hypothetical protein